MSLDNITPEDWDSLARQGITQKRYDDTQKGYDSPLNIQVDGQHYKKFKIQPVEFIHSNNIPFCEASAIKYLCRWRDKGGIKDLEKARHFIDLLIELESKNDK